MTDSQNRFAARPPRQKMMGVIFLMVAIFVGWEVIGMFSGGKTAIAANAPVPTPKPPLPQAPPAAVQQAVSPPPSPPARPSVSLSPQESRPKPVESAPPSSIVLVQQEQVQNKYVSALNELQMLKIQKEIAETSQAIVAAKLATATAEKSITDLLSEVITPRKGSSVEPSSVLVTPLPPTPKPSVVELGGGYLVQSVSMEQDEWHAVVKFKNKLYSVGVGDLLPPDKSLVKTIDQRGVVIENAGVEQRIPLSITDNETPPTTPSPSGASSGSSGSS